MSISFLKNLLFPSRRPALRRNSSSTRPLLADSSRSSYTETASESDLESQTTGTVSGSMLRESTRHSMNARIISDATIGLSDGLTVPFALTAGLSALSDTRIVIFGGLAELIAGAISMGLGGYLGAMSEAASYRELKRETELLVSNEPGAVYSEIREVFTPFNLPKDTIDDVCDHLAGSPGVVEFLMQFRHCTQEPPAERAWVSALTIALSYFFGGLIPLAPYFFIGPGELMLGLYISVCVMAVALFTFGYVKTCVVSGWSGYRSVRRAIMGGIQMMVVGGAAAGAAMVLVRLFDKMSAGEGAWYAAAS